VGAFTCVDFGVLAGDGFLDAFAWGGLDVPEAWDGGRVVLPWDGGLVPVNRRWL